MGGKYSPGTLYCPFRMLMWHNTLPTTKMFSVTEGSPSAKESLKIFNKNKF